MIKDKQTKISVLIATSFASFLTPFMGSSVNIAIPSMAREFLLSARALGWITTAYLLAAVVCLVPSGRLGDVYGRKKIFLAGISIFILSAVGCILSSSGFMLILCRSIQGIGSAMIFSTSIALLSSTFPQEERGKVLGISSASVYLGLTVGPFLGGMLTHQYGWRSIFWIIIPIGLLVMFLMVNQFSEEHVHLPHEQFDYGGALLYSVSLLLLLYGMSIIASLWGVVSVILGIIGLGIFIRWELLIHNPMLSLSIFVGNRIFVFSNIASLLNYSATFSIGFMLSLFLQYIKGFNSQTTGIILVAQPLIMTVCAPFAGMLADTIQPRYLASAGMGLTCMGLFLLAFIHQATPLMYIMGSLIIVGLGLAFFASPNTTAVMSSIERSWYGAGSGILGTMRLMGQMLSMGCATLIISMYLGKATITPTVYPLFIQSMRMTFMVSALLCFVGIFASLARGKK